MKPSHMIRIVGLILCPWLCMAADEAAWKAYDAAVKELRAQELEAKLCQAAIDACREFQPAAPVAAARKQVADAEKAVTAAQATGELGAAYTKMQEMRSARDAKVESLIGDAPAYRAAKDRQEALKKKIADLEQRAASLKPDDWIELARSRGEEQHLSKRLGGAVRGWWKRGEIQSQYKEADAAYRAYGAASKAAAPLAQTNESLKAARQALATAVAAVELNTPAGKELLARQKAITTKVEELKGKIGGMEATLLAGKTVTATSKSVDPKTKQERTRTWSLWLPECDQIRGVVMAHPMINGLANAHPMRVAAARAGLGLMVYDEFSYNTAESVQRIDSLLEQFAAQSKHPELKGAPLLLGGLSASVLFTRSIACAFPSRVFGIVHAAGGNMQEMPEGGRGMIQVPFLAMNGEFEWCGPIGGIQPAYGNQTQWLMIREQMLRLWRDKQEHRMSLVVVPNADHGAWDQELTALFVRKAAQYRIPNEKRDGSQPAVCRPLPVNQGWLTDADLDHPKYEPAPYDSYKGDKNNAFWHFDEEMARAVFEYHKNQFLLPDPTKTHPIPASWPPAQ